MLHLRAVAQGLARSVRDREVGGSNPPSPNLCEDTPSFVRGLHGREVRPARKTTLQLVGSVVFFRSDLNALTRRDRLGSARGHGWTLSGGARPGRSREDSGDWRANPPGAPSPARICVRTHQTLSVGGRGGRRVMCAVATPCQPKKSCVELPYQVLRLSFCYLYPNIRVSL